jgi:dihydroflavonol-4-reductase
VYLGWQEANLYMDAGYPLITMIPCALFGPQVLPAESGITRLIRCALSDGKVFLPEGGTRVWTYAFVDDVVRGILNAFENGRTGRNYILGGECMEVRRFLAQAGNVSGREIEIAEDSRVANLLRACMSPRTHARAPAAEIRKLLRHNWAYYSSRAVRELSYTITPVTEALERTCAVLT